MKFPGDNRTHSDAIQLSSALLEEYINPPKYRILTEEKEEQRESLATDNSLSETPNPLVELSSSNPSDINHASSLAEESKIETKRLSSLSTSNHFPASEIPNKVAYIAVQISAIQDLRA